MGLIPSTFTLFSLRVTFKLGFLTTKTIIAFDVLNAVSLFQKVLKNTLL